MPFVLYCTRNLISETMSQIGMFAVVMAVASGVALAGDPGWNAAMSAIQIDCSQPGVSQDIIPFVGFKDECDDDTKVIYEPKDSTQHLDMVIDARNSDTVEWDTARYKRYGTYWPTSNVTWHVPNGFTNFWSRIYYAVDNDKKFEPMKYQYSKDGQAWTPVPNVQYDVNVVCIQEGCNWYKRKEEQASWSEPMFYFKAIWPAPCAGEIGATYAADQRKCLSLPPPGWTGTLEEFDASPIKDLYYTPQMAEIHMGTSDLTPGSPQNLKLTPGQGSVLATWDPPANPKEPIIGYVVYYQLDSPAAATMPNYKPPYLASHMNVGMVSGVVLKNISPTSTIIVRVAAVTQRGAGPSTLNVWTQPNGNGVPSCPASLPPVATVSPQGLTPAPDGAQGGHQQLTGNANHQSTSTSDAHGSVLSALVIFLASIIFVLF